jgi:hypothetical protein
MKNHMLLCAHLARNSVNVYGNKNSTRHKMYRKIKQVPTAQYTV